MKNAEVIAIVEPGVRTVIRFAPQRRGETREQALQRQRERTERIERQTQSKCAERGGCFKGNCCLA